MRQFLLGVCITFSVTSMHAQGEGTTSVLQPHTAPTVVPKAVWLMETSAATLRHAITLQAVIQTNEYKVHADTLPRYVRIDTVRFHRSGAAYRSWLVLDSPFTEWRVTASTTHACITGALRLRTLHQTAENAEENTHRWARRCRDGDTVWARQEIAQSVQAFYPRPMGRDLDVREWDIDRVNDPLTDAVTYEGTTTWNGGTYDVVQWICEKAYTMPKEVTRYTVRVFLDENHLVRRIVTTNSKTEYRTDEQVLALTLDSPLSEADFVWTPPRNVTVSEAIPHKSSAVIPDTTKQMTGTSYPTFRTPAHFLDSSQVLAHDVFRGKKGTFFWFWNTTCSSCIEHFPYFEQLYQEFKDRGIQVVAVNVVTEPSEIIAAREYRTFHHAAMPILFVDGDWNAWSRTWPYVIVNGEGTIIDSGTTNKAVLRNLFIKLATAPVAPSSQEIRGN